jgi:D-Tyr-tRNAtyr deacylase
MYLYLAMSLYRILKREDEEVQMFLYGIAVYFSYNIVQHHASMLLEAQNEIVWSDERLQELSPYLSLLAGYDFTEEFVKQFHFILQHTSGRVVMTGEFGADMQVALVNDGPVTIWIDSKMRDC